MNLEMTTSCSFETEAASERYVSRSWCECATFMAAPLRTYDGRTRQGYPISSHHCLAACKIFKNDVFMVVTS